mmetsp:Transcript_59944/g.165913  ORF Transcript_59944/g.165913 Transcript_59944/m.165913 type:complete len:282 (+) Transcript_59944:931-1776(+)
MTLRCGWLACCRGCWMGRCGVWPWGCRRSFHGSCASTLWRACSPSSLCSTPLSAAAKGEGASRCLSWLGTGTSGSLCGQHSKAPTRWCRRRSTRARHPRGRRSRWGGATGRPRCRRCGSRSHRRSHCHQCRRCRLLIRATGPRNRPKPTKARRPGGRPTTRAAEQRTRPKALRARWLGGAAPCGSMKRRRHSSRPARRLTPGAVRSLISCSVGSTILRLSRQTDERGRRHRSCSSRSRTGASGCVRRWQIRSPLCRRWSFLRAGLPSGQAAMEGCCITSTC